MHPPSSNSDTFVTPMFNNLLQSNKFKHSTEQVNYRNKQTIGAKILALFFNKYPILTNLQNPTIILQFMNNLIPRTQNPQISPNISPISSYSLHPPTSYTKFTLFNKLGLKSQDPTTKN